MHLCLCVRFCFVHISACVCFCVSVSVRVFVCLCVCVCVCVASTSLMTPYCDFNVCKANIRLFSRNCEQERPDRQSAESFCINSQAWNSPFAFEGHQDSRQLGILTANLKLASQLLAKSAKKLSRWALTKNLIGRYSWYLCSCITKRCN